MSASAPCPACHHPAHEEQCTVLVDIDRMIPGKDLAEAVEMPCRCEET